MSALVPAVRDYLDYDAETGVFVWRVARNNRVRVGGTAGSLDAAGYVIIPINRKNYKWCASIRHQGRNKHLGYFTDAAEAHAVYVDAARRTFGEFARA